jgi:hypothetical protein
VCSVPAEACLGSTATKYLFQPSIRRPSLNQLLLLHVRYGEFFYNKLALSCSAAAVPQIIKKRAFVSFYSLNRKREKNKGKQKSQSVENVLPDAIMMNSRIEETNGVIESKRKKKTALLSFRFVYSFRSLFSGPDWPSTLFFLKCQDATK